MQAQCVLDEVTSSHSVMLFQQLIMPPMPPPNNHNQSKLRVNIFTITQAATGSARTTFVKPIIKIDDCVAKSMPRFSRVLFSCVNGCVTVWLPGHFLTILAMNFSHPCIGGITLDSFRCVDCAARVC
jgi:hypothetical protein